MGKITRDVRALQDGLMLASEGAGPLLQRDYWAVIRGCRLTPHEVALYVREHFPDFPPRKLVTFQRKDGSEGPLEVGDELEIKIRMAGRTAVRVLHVDANSITLGTLKGHPEAGRITFGAYRNERGDVIFHIRSRARSSSSTRYAGFLATGEPMQTNTWTDFIDRLAHTVGDGVIGAIRVETQVIEEENPGLVHGPTFIATGD